MTVSKLTTIPAHPGWKVAELYGDDDGFFLMDVIGWLVEIDEGTDGGPYAATPIPVLVESTFDETRSAIVSPDGQWIFQHDATKDDDESGFAYLKERVHRAELRRAKKREEP